MRNVVLANFAAALTLGLAACGNGVVEVPQPTGEAVGRIVGGSLYDGLPAVGVLLYDGIHQCTGTLVGPRKVLTAGHCVYGYSASRMAFGIGPRVDELEVVIQAASAKAHPEFDPYDVQNDVAFVTLEEDAPETPMGVVTDMDSSWVGKTLFFVGYGVTNGTTQKGGGIKRAVNMKITDLDATRFMFGGGGKNTCSGDSGGPAFFKDSNGKYLVAGTTSFGDAACAQFGVDTRVDPYLDFLGLDGAEPDPEPCQGETAEGRCDGNTLVWCANNKVRRQNCATAGKECGFDEATERFGCLDEGTPDPCEGETYEGRCDGDTVIWCENDAVQQQDCAADGKQCGFDSAKGLHGCGKVVPVDPCNGETWEGRCEDGSLIWCEDDQVKSMNCEAVGERCDYVDSKGYNDCTW